MEHRLSTVTSALCTLDHNRLAFTSEDFMDKTVKSHNNLPLVASYNTQLFTVLLFFFFFFGFLLTVDVNYNYLHKMCGRKF